MIPIENVVSTFLFDFYARHKPILHRLAKVHNAAGDSVRNRLPSIGGLKIGFITP